jgi:hypothetical protein
MRIRLIHRPRRGCIEGVDLTRFQVGLEYEVGNAIAAVFLSEKWAVPVASDEPAVLVPLNNTLIDELQRLREHVQDQLHPVAEAHHRKHNRRP